MAHLQVTDEADERELHKLNVEAWEQNNRLNHPSIKHLKVSRFSFGTVQNEQIDYEQLARHKENVKPNKHYEVLKYDPSLMSLANSKANFAPDRLDTSSAMSKAQGTHGTMAGEIKLPVEPTGGTEDQLSHGQSPNNNETVQVQE